MKKHIKVHAKLINKETEVLLTLLECSAIGKDFGSREEPHKWGLTGRYGAFIANKVRMYSAESNYFPSEFSDEWATNRGDEDYGKADLRFRVGVVGSQCKIPIKHWPRIKAAIEEYNEWGDSQ